MEFTIDHKVGDTISWDVNYTDDLGGVVDITNYEIKCQARLKDNKEVILFDLTSVGTTPAIDKYNAVNGNFRIVVDTTDFTVARYVVDIQYKLGSLIKSSETFELNIYEDVTR